jgi:hypothetical protein
MPFGGNAFQALAVAIVPDAARLDAREWDEVSQIIDEALADRPASLALQLHLLLGLLEWAPVLRHGRRLSRLDPERRERFLQGVENAPLFLRRGFWGLRTLVLMGYYARPEAARAIGYRASRFGWEARA